MPSIARQVPLDAVEVRPDLMKDDEEQDDEMAIEDDDLELLEDDKE